MWHNLGATAVQCESFKREKERDGLCALLTCNTDLFFIKDVIGVCKTVEEVTRLTTKSNREVSKRTLSLMDMSGKVVTVTLWGEEVSIDIMCRLKHIMGKSCCV